METEQVPVSFSRAGGVTMKSVPSIIELSNNRITVRSGLSGNVESRETIQPAIKPIVKWAGGKQWLAPAGPYLIPDKFTGRFYEPFVGGGAMFFAVEPALATLLDRNDTLITAYRALRNDTESV